MGGDPAKGFVIGGISAGGNLAAVISHIYRDEKMSPPLTGIYLSVPMLVGPEAVPGKFKHQYLSREQNKTAPILNKEAMALFRGTLRPRIVPNSDCGWPFTILPSQLQGRSCITTCVTTYLPHRTQKPAADVFPNLWHVLRAANRYA
jgi:acetyl esterase/lipase